MTLSAPEATCSAISHPRKTQLSRNREWDRPCREGVGMGKCHPLPLPGVCQDHPGQAVDRSEAFIWPLRAPQPRPPKTPIWHRRGPCKGLGGVGVQKPSSGGRRTALPGVAQPALCPQELHVGCVSPVGPGQGWGGVGWHPGRAGLGGRAGRPGPGRDLARRPAWGCAQRWRPGRRRPRRGRHAPPRPAC